MQEHTKGHLIKQSSNHSNGSYKGLTRLVGQVMKWKFKFIGSGKTTLSSNEQKLWRFI